MLYIIQPIFTMDPRPQTPTNQGIVPKSVPQHDQDRENKRRDEKNCQPNGSNNPSD